LVRTRGELMLYLVTADAAGSGFQWAFGMCMVSSTAAGIGVTAVPGPITDIGWDGWFVYEVGTLESASADVTVQPGNNTAQRIMIDSKAMRKWKETDVAFGVLQVVERGTATMRASLDSRMLVKLP